MKNWHYSYSQKVHLTIATLWIVSLPIPIFSMQPEQQAQEQAVIQVPAATPEQIPQAQQPQVDAAPTAGQAPEVVESVEKIGTQGNWLKKREWLIKAHETTNEIQEIAAQTEQVRKSFIDAYNDVDTILDKYYQELGLGDGKMQGLFSSIKRYLEKKQKKERTALEAAHEKSSDAVLQAKIENLEESIKPLKQQLSQLKLDMKSIDDLSKSLTDRIKRVDEQMGIIQEQASKSKNIANQMWDIIDHNKARDSYYELKLSILEKTKAINSYLKDDLFNDFGSVITTIKTQIARTQEQIKKLEADGLFIKDRAQQIKDFKVKELEAQQQTDTQKKDAAQKEPVKTVTPPSSLLDKVRSLLANVIKYALDRMLWIKEKIMGTPPKPQDAPKADQPADGAPVQQPTQSTQPQPQAPMSAPVPPAPVPQMPSVAPVAMPMPQPAMQIPQAQSLMPSTVMPTPGNPAG